MDWKKNTCFEAALVFFISLLIFTTGLFNHEFVEFESRFALFAQEMLRNGLSFFPTTYNKPYPDYLAIHTMFIYWSALFFNKLTIVSAVFPSALACALTVMLTYLIGESRIRFLGLYAVLFELLTYEFLTSARTISLDAFTLLATTFCFWSVCSTRRHPLWLVSLGLCFGFLLRGPIGLVVPAAVVCTFYLLEKDFRKLIVIALISTVLFIVGMVFLLLAAKHQGGSAFVKEVITMQIIGRLNHTEGLQPFYYYFFNALTNYAISFPVAVLVSGSVIRRYFKTPSNSDLKFICHCIAWMFVVLIGLSIPSAKKIRYLLPIVPAASLIAAYSWLGVQDSPWLQKIRIFLRLFYYSLPAISLILIVGCQILIHFKLFSFDAYFLIASIFLGLLTVFTTIITPKIREKNIRDFALFFAGLSAFLTLMIAVIQPIMVQLNQVKPFVKHIEEVRNPKQKIVFYRITSDGTAIKFMAAWEKPLQPLFLENPQEILKFNAPALFITTQKDFQQLPLEIKKNLKLLFEGKLGHENGVVFININQSLH